MGESCGQDRPRLAAAVAARLDATIEELRGCLGSRGGLVWLEPNTLISPHLIKQLAADLPAYKARQAKRERVAAEKEAALLTTAQAAEMFGVTPEAVRQWTTRGYLKPIGKLGHGNLYRYRDVKSAAAAVDRRTAPEPHVDYTVDESDHSKNVTTAIAGRIVGVKPGTIRMWIQRGHLTPVGRYRGRLVFRLGDVINVAQRGT